MEGLKVGSLGASIYNIAQTEQLHQKEVDLAKDFHNKSIELEIEQHEKDCMAERQRYLISAYTSLAQHFHVRCRINYFVTSGFSPFSSPTVPICYSNTYSN